MPNSDTWPRAVAVETLSNMDSAHSCDSVISVVSACSEDSMEHLSAEEKACLMYLEETIESLDLQEDSGFSNDEPDPANLKRKQVSDSLLEPEISSNILSVLAESTSSSDQPEPDIPQSSDSDSSDVPSHIPLELTPAVLQPSSGSATPVPASQDTDVQNSFIPPPSDFMDEPPSPATPSSDCPSSPSPKSTINLDVLRRRVSEKSSPKISPLITALARLPTSPTKSIPEKSVGSSLALVDPVPITQSTIPATPESPATAVDPVSTAVVLPSEVPVEPKNPPPAVAPKPKKLPPNIILKSLKSPGHDSSVGHQSPMATERPLMDPQKVRMEALRKLGLLKSQDGDPGHKVVHTRRSWAPASTPPIPSPKSPPASAPYFSKVQSAVPERAETLPDIIPVPAAFSDDIHNVFSDPGSSVLDKFASSAGAGAKSATLERSGLGLGSGLERAKLTMGELRNARPRPASLGNGKDFSGTVTAQTTSTSTAGTSDNSQKLPRSQGISVLICPRAQDEEARRDALRKLGLLRD